MKLDELDKFHKTSAGYLLFGLAELALAYLFFDLAADSGSLWQWALTLVAAFGAVQNLIKFFWSLLHVRKKSRT